MAAASATASSVVVRVAAVASMGLLLVSSGVSARHHRPVLGSLASPLDLIRQVGEGAASGWRYIDEGLVALAVIAAVVATVLLVSRRRSHDSETPWPALLAVAGLVGGAAAVTAGLWAAVAGAATVVVVAISWQATRNDLRSSAPRATDLLLLILLVGLAARCVLPARHPAGFGTHGIAHLRPAVAVAERLDGVAAMSGDGPIRRRFVEEQHGPMALVNLLGFEVFGVGLVEARLTQAVLGTLVVLLAYCFGRSLVDAATGLLLAFLVAVSPWHVAMSRFNDAEHVLAPLQALLAGWLVLRAGRLRTVGAWAIAGGACALGWYVYAANQLLLPVLVGFAIATVATAGGGSGRRWMWLAAFGAVLLVVSAPHLRQCLAAGSVPLRSSVRFSGESAYRVRWAANLSRGATSAASQLYWVVDEPWYTKRFGGGLDPLLGATLPAGLVWCLLPAGRRRLGRSWPLLPLWVLAGFLPALVLDSVFFRQLIQLELAAQILTAVLLVEVGRLWWRSTSARRTIYVAVPAAAMAWGVVALAAYWNRVHVPESEDSTYWVRMTEDARAHLGQVPIIVVLAGEIEGLEDNRTAIRLALYRELRAREVTVETLGRQLQLVALDRLHGEAAAVLQAGSPVRVLAAPWVAGGPSHPLSLARIVRGLDPNALDATVTDADGRPQLFVWQLAPTSRQEACDRPPARVGVELVRKGGIEPPRP